MTLGLDSSIFRHQASENQETLKAKNKTVSALLQQKREVQRNRRTVIRGGHYPGIFTFCLSYDIFFHVTHCIVQCVCKAFQPNVKKNKKKKTNCIYALVRQST